MKSLHFLIKFRCVSSIFKHTYGKKLNHYTIHSICSEVIIIKIEDLILNYLTPVK